MTFDRLESGEPAAASLQLVSGEFFGGLRLQAQLGRLLSPEDNRAIGGHPVAVISDAFWRRQFNGAADAIGRELTLNGAGFTIIGVAPPGFAGVWLESPVEVWVPVMMQAVIRYVAGRSGHAAQRTGREHAAARAPGGAADDGAGPARPWGWRVWGAMD